MHTPDESAMTVLAIPGSLRRSSYNRGLLEAASACAPAGMHIRLYDALATLPLFDEDLERATAGGPEPVRLLRQAVASADALLIATPEYNQSVPGVLKNAIDWLSRPAPAQVLAGKPVAILGATQGRWGTRLAQSHLRHILTATESLVLARPSLFVREADRLFDGAGRLSDAATRAALWDFLAGYATWLERLGLRPGRAGGR